MSIASHDIGSQDMQRKDPELPLGEKSHQANGELDLWTNGHPPALVAFPNFPPQKRHLSYSLQPLFPVQKIQTND
jgi:hypothetical protein